MGPLTMWIARRAWDKKNGLTTEQLLEGIRIRGIRQRGGLATLAGEVVEFKWRKPPEHPMAAHVGSARARRGQRLAAAGCAAHLAAVVARRCLRVHPAQRRHPPGARMTFKEAATSTAICTAVGTVFAIAWTIIEELLR
jgi:hypothetical protein